MGDISLSVIETKDSFLVKKSVKTGNLISYVAYIYQTPALVGQFILNTDKLNTENSITYHPSNHILKKVNQKCIENAIETNYH